MSRRSGSFFKGLMFGAVAGAVAGVLLAPKSGEETRADLKKAADEFAVKAKDAYTEAKKVLDKKIVALKKAGKKIDEGKYKKLVDNVVSEFKNDSEVTSDAAKQLSAQLKKDWAIVKDALSKASYLIFFIYLNGNIRRIQKRSQTRVYSTPRRGKRSNFIQVARHKYSYAYSTYGTAGRNCTFRKER